MRALWCILGILLVAAAVILGMSIERHNLSLTGVVLVVIATIGAASTSPLAWMLLWRKTQKRRILEGNNDVL